ncbi:DUF2157 domain-containing protein [Bacteroides sp.]|uniref:DUF2157 domain-containing protein n=1 Tax=Bacteroides sp. TaxID=29523 RepID=UPI00261881DB|nr:DUF2157 domain-containing protein [Bacteroides sp.]MDD3039876.1 DUF2157 domain-containing protein [Bacteroides sp.]
MEKPDYSSSFRQPMYANKKQWNQFLSIFLLTAGIGFTVAGIIFFFAYNWDALPKFVKLGMVEVLLATTVLLTIFTRWNLLTKQILLTGATFLTGTLFAVFGQIYQTGADAYDLFLGWTLFTFLWAIAIRFAPLWLTFLGLLCITLWLYTLQIIPGEIEKVALLTNAVTWICALATILAERMNVKRKLAEQNHWFIKILSVATIIHASYLIIAAIVEKENLILLPLASVILLFPIGLWFGWKQRNLFYLSIIPFAILMILLFLYLFRSQLGDTELFLGGGLIMITGTTLLIYAILNLKKKWYGTEE